MKTTKLRALALTLAVVLVAAALAGCQTSIPNPVVMKVGDVEISYTAYKNAYNEVYQAYSNISMYNVDTAEEVREFQEKVFAHIAEYAVTADQAQKAGVELTEDDLSNVNAQVEYEINLLISNYAKSVTSYASQDDYYKQATALLEKDLATNTGMNLEQYTEAVRAEYRIKALANKYEEEITKDAFVPDGDVETYYNALVEKYTPNYKDNAQKYFEDYMSYADAPDTTLRPLYAPAGFYFVKVISIFAQDASATDASGSDASASEASATDASSTNASKAIELANEALAKIEAGTPFDEVLKEYNESTTDNVEPYATHGYLMNEVAESYYPPAIYEEAMKLKKVGDHSGVVEYGGGAFIIYRNEDVAEGVIPLEDIQDFLYKQLLNSAKLKIYKDKTAEWLESTQVTEYYDRVKNFIITPKS